VEEAEEGVGDATFVRAVGHDSSGDADDDEDEEEDRGEVEEEEEEEEEDEDESGAEAEAVSTGDEADGGWYGGPEAERADDEDEEEDDEDDDDADDEACLAAMALRTARMSTEANGCDIPIASTASDSALAADTRPLESTRMR
jgi:hypothetical protein